MVNSWNLLRLTISSLFLALVLIFVSGCGGGGGGSTDTGGMNLFISDDFNTDYDQVWVTIHQVEVRNATSGEFRTVFNSDDGLVVNLSALNDGNARFMYLGNERITSANYAGARITMDKDLTLVATGQPMGEAAVFDSAFDFGSGKSRVEFNFAAPITVNGNDNLVVDFDLANWQKLGANVTPVFVRGSDATLGDPSRHEVATYEGTVRSLSGGSSTQTFTLQKDGGDIEVSVDSDTVVFNENSSSNPTLSNAQEVEVQGRFDIASNRLMATSVEIESGASSEDRVEGSTSNLNLLNNTVDVYADEVDGFLPLNAVVKVALDTSTQFFSNSGAPMTLSEATTELATGVKIEAEGSFSATTNTLTAAKLKIDAEEDHEVEAQGAISNINGLAGTFDVALDSWFGFNGSSGQTFAVTTSLATTFYDDDENVVTSAEFFAAVTAGSIVEVEGELSGTTIAATKVKIEDPSIGASEAKGYVSVSSELTGTVTISLIEWSGFNGGFGNEIVIQTTGTTEFRDADGDPITEAEFFGALSVGVVVDAQGSFSAGVLTASRARLRD